MIAVCDLVSEVGKRCERTALGEDGLEVAFEEGAGVLEVLFGVGFGGGEALKRFVQQADDPLLFGQRGEGNFRVLDFDLRDIGLRVAGCLRHQFIFLREQEVEQELRNEFFVWEDSANRLIRRRFKPQDADLPRRRAIHCDQDGVLREKFGSGVLKACLRDEVLRLAHIFLSHFAANKPRNISAIVIFLPRTQRCPARACLGDFAQRFPCPPLLHSSALMLPSTSALSAFSAAISSMISCGLRCVISSPPLGFFTDKSKVFGSMASAPGRPVANGLNRPSAR